VGNELADLGIREADGVDEAEYTPMMSPIDLSYSDLLSSIWWTLAKASDPVAGISK
jgi:hypothetical protein